MWEDYYSRNVSKECVVHYERYYGNRNIGIERIVGFFAGIGNDGGGRGPQPGRHVLSRICGRRSRRRTDRKLSDKTVIR